MDNYSMFVESNPELIMKVIPSFLMVFIGAIAALITLIMLIVKAASKKKVKGAVIAFIISLLVLGGGIIFAAKTALDIVQSYSSYTYEQKMDEYVGETDRISFTTNDKDRNPVDSSVFSDYELTILNRWEPWCGPCKGEMPDLQKLYEQYSGKVNIIGIYSDEENLNETLKSLNISYPIVQDCEGFTFMELGGSVPTTMFVDSEGHLLEIPEAQRSSTIKGSLVSDSETGAMFDRYAMEGARSYEVWNDLIQGYLAK